MKKWQPSADKRPKADDVYQRRLSNDEKAMGNARQRNGSRFSPLAEINDEQTMNWQHHEAGGRCQRDEHQPSRRRLDFTHNNRQTA